MVWSQSAKLVGIALVRSNRTLGAIPWIVQSFEG